MLYFSSSLGWIFPFSSVTDESAVISSDSTGTASNDIFKRNFASFQLFLKRRLCTYMHCICFILHFVPTCNGACSVL